MAAASSSGALPNVGAGDDGDCNNPLPVASPERSLCGSTDGTLALALPAVAAVGGSGGALSLATTSSPSSRRRVEVALELQAALCLDRASTIELVRFARGWNPTERRRRLAGFRGRNTPGVDVSGGGPTLRRRRLPLPRDSVAQVRCAVLAEKQSVARNNTDSSPPRALPAAQSTAVASKPTTLAPPTFVWATWRGDALRLGSLPVCCPDMFATSLNLIGLVDLCQFRGASVGAAVAADREYQSHLRDFRFHPRLFESHVQKSRSGRPLLAPKYDAERRLARFLIWPHHVDRFERLDLGLFAAVKLENEDAMLTAIGRMRRLNSLVLPSRGWSTPVARNRFLNALPQGLSVSESGAEVISTSQAAARQVQSPLNVKGDDDSSPRVGLRELIHGWDSFAHVEMAKVHTHLRNGASLGKFPQRRGPKWNWCVDDSFLPAVREYLATLEDPCLTNSIVSESAVEAAWAISKKACPVAENQPLVPDALSATASDQIELIDGEDRRSSAELGDASELEKTDATLVLRNLVSAWDSLSHLERGTIHAHLRFGVQSGKFPRPSKTKWAWRLDDPSLHAVRAHLAELPLLGDMRGEASGGVACPSCDGSPRGSEHPSRKFNSGVRVSTVETQGAMATPPRSRRLSFVGSIDGAGTDRQSQDPGDFSPAMCIARSRSSGSSCVLPTPDLGADARSAGAHPASDGCVGLVKLRSLVPRFDQLGSSERTLLHAYLRKGACAGVFPPKTGYRWQWMEDDPCLPALREYLARFRCIGLGVSHAVAAALQPSADDGINLTQENESSSLSSLRTPLPNGQFREASLQLRDLLANWDALSKADRQRVDSYVDAGADAGKFPHKTQAFWEWKVDDPFLVAVRAHLAEMPTIHDTFEPSHDTLKVASATNTVGTTAPADDDAGVVAATRLRTHVPGWDELPDLERVLVVAHLRAGVVAG
eukprot:TRINITY_DN12074_c0_g1_i2.p1 TRINITY_DN12074_c0_g1~~TRINITY_DN12074_c0_g1_i2.p1  ORF type:complete len:941 (-),score=143.61 TRINITY_DN12074_c0_g1_i2:166-2988(-)